MSADREAVRQTMRVPDGVSRDELLNAYAATIAARVRAEAGQAALEAETKRADVMGEVWEAGRAMGRRENDAEWRARVEGAKRSHSEHCPRADNITHNCLCGVFTLNAGLQGIIDRADALLTAVARDREGPQ